MAELIQIFVLGISLGGVFALMGAGPFLLSVVAAFVGAWIGSTWSTMTFFLALFLILLLRPQGLFGEKLEHV